MNKMVTWQAPSNIAIVKYWGKKEGQRPENPSVSFSLKNCVTRMQIRLETATALDVKFLLKGQEKKKFSERIKKNLMIFSEYYNKKLPYLFKIESENTFPHSAGIASSASSQAALSLCLQTLFFGEQDDFYKRSSFMARLFSGSACRSVYGGWNEWGIESEEYATSLQNVHPLFTRMGDSILVVAEEEKSISSSQGHETMREHPQAQRRYVQATQHAQQLLEILKDGNWNKFSLLAQKEAKILHELMRTAPNPYSLLKPQTESIMQKIEEDASLIPMTYTLDAGPNVHLLYPLEEKEKVIRYIQNELSPFFKFAIHDEIGSGPCLL